MTTPANIYSFEAENIRDETISLDRYKGKVLLIVNTASACGFTPQYEGLEQLYKKYQAQGFEVLGFPCNQFGGQESGTNEQIAQFCDLKFKTTFPMFAKIEVNGADTHPLYAFLKKEAKGLLGTEAIKWNFTKFLVGRDGVVIDRFAPKTEPSELEKPIEQALKA